VTAQARADIVAWVQTYRLSKVLPNSKSFISSFKDGQLISEILTYDSR
jgi:hypothetical protein